MTTIDVEGTTFEKKQKTLDVQYYLLYTIFTMNYYHSIYYDLNVSYSPWSKHSTSFRPGPYTNCGPICGTVLRFDDGNSVTFRKYPALSSLLDSGASDGRVILAGMFQFIILIYFIFIIIITYIFI